MPRRNYPKNQFSKNYGRKKRLSQEYKKPRWIRRLIKKMKISNS